MDAIEISYNDLPRVVGQILRDTQEIKNLLESMVKVRDRKYLTFNEARAYIYEKAGKRFAKSTFYTLASKRMIPYLKIGGTLAFEPAELDAWIAKNYNKSVDQLKNENDKLLQEL